MATHPMTATEYKQATRRPPAELIPREDHNRWMLTSHSALNGNWPALAMQTGNEAAVYQLLVRMKQGN